MIYCLKHGCKAEKSPVPINSPSSCKGAVQQTELLKTFFVFCLGFWSITNFWQQYCYFERLKDPVLLHNPFFLSYGTAELLDFQRGLNIPGWVWIVMGHPQRSLLQHHSVWVNCSVLLLKGSKYLLLFLPPNNI